MKRILLRYATLAGLLASIVWLALEPHWHPLIVSISLLATFIASDARLSTTPSIAGRWEYEVTTANREFSHKGDCHIHQEGVKVRLEGVRRFTCSVEQQRRVSRTVNIAWDSKWAQICDDETLRFEYNIAIAEPKRGGAHIDAICRLMLTSKRPNEMVGNYYMLPPFDETTLNCKWGTIVFRKLEENAELLPPTACGPDEDEEFEHLG